MNVDYLWDSALWSGAGFVLGVLVGRLEVTWWKHRHPTRRAHT